MYFIHFVSDRVGLCQSLLAISFFSGGADRHELITGFTQTSLQLISKPRDLKKTVVPSNDWPSDRSLISVLDKHRLYIKSLLINE